MLIEIHMLKNYPPVNLNRDDSGAPKTCFFGGVQRGRISSQCLKRSWRTSEIFKSLNGNGIRTRCMPEKVRDRLMSENIDESYAKAAAEVLVDFGKSKKRNQEENKGDNQDKKSTKELRTQIIMYSQEEWKQIIDAVSQYVKKYMEGSPSPKTKDFQADVQEWLNGQNFGDKKPVSIDIALFGRMVTSSALVDVNASMQVAHAISTHAVNRESDYFTAVDDLNENREEQDSGAGMIGDVDYNSCCYYEYASVDVDLLKANLANASNREELVEKLIPTLLRAMAYTNPSGKQNTFAGQVVPDVVLVECKAEKIPLSYVNAFEEPVSTWGGSHVVECSVKKLTDHVNLMDESYELPVLHRAFFAPRFANLAPDKGEAYSKFSELTAACVGWLQEEK